MRCNGSNWAVYSPGSWDGFRNDVWALWAGVIMRLEHHLVGGYVRYISPYIIIITMIHLLDQRNSSLSFHTPSPPDTRWNIQISFSMDLNSAESLAGSFALNFCRISAVVACPLSSAWKDTKSLMSSRRSCCGSSTEDWLLGSDAVALLRFLICARRDCEVGRVVDLGLFWDAAVSISSFPEKCLGFGDEAGFCWNEEVDFYFLTQITLQDFFHSFYY